MSQVYAGFNLWVQRQNLENPLANHAVLSRCLFAVLYSSYGQRYEPDVNTQPINDSPHTLYRHVRRKRHKKKKLVKVRQNKNGKNCIVQAISAGFAQLESSVKDQLGKMGGKIAHFEEKWEKEATEQRSLIEYLHRELDYLKGTAYYLRNNTLQGQALGGQTGTHSIAIREDMATATHAIKSIEEKAPESEDNQENTAASPENDPLEELLNKKCENRMIGFKLRENKKGASGEEDPIMALLAQGNEDKENTASEVEIVRPKKLMFQMKKGKDGGKPPASMDDLLFG